MVLYLVRKYYINSFVFFAGFIIFPFAAFGDLANLFPRAVFLGGLGGAIYTWYDFRKKHLWPLFDNLQHSKFTILGLMFSSLQFIPPILIFLL
jgi:hypothetical protein